MIYRIERVVTENEKIAAWFPLIRLVVNVIVLGHVVAIIYHLIAIYEIEIQNNTFSTWLHTQSFLGANWDEKYL